MNELYSMKEINASRQNVYADKVMSLALELGRKILEYGGDVHRVEDTITRICKAYGVKKVDVISITSIMILTIEMADGYHYTSSRVIKNSYNNLYAVEKLNSLSRKICNEQLPIDEALKMFEEIKNVRPYTTWIVILGAMLGCGGFTLFMGGSFVDCFAVMVVGFICYYIDLHMMKNIYNLAHTFMLTFIGGVLIILLNTILPINTNISLTGIIMTFIPGLVLGNSMRDMLTGDIITGLLRLFQSILNALGIVSGILLSVFLLKGLILNDYIINPFAKEVWFRLLSSIISAIGFSLLFSIDIKKIPFAAIGALLTYGAYLLVEQYLNLLFINIIASVVACLYAEILARIIKAPTPVIQIPSIIVLVPGGLLFKTISNLIDWNELMFFEYATDTIMVALGISIGTILVSILVQTIIDTKKSIKYIKKKLLKRKNLKND